jgi:hypothetical protein
MPAFTPLAPEAIERIRAVFKDYIDKPVWVGWKPKQLPSGKYTKPPYNPNDPSKMADPGDSATWGTFDEVLAIHLRGEFAGVGICSLGAPFLNFFDLDNCILTGNVVHPYAEQLIKELQTYVEVSPSGKGLRFIGISQNNAPINRKQSVPGHKGLSLETCRNSAKYFTVTGNIMGAIEQPTNGPAVAEKIVENLEAKSKEKPKTRAWKGGVDIAAILRDGGSPRWLREDGQFDRSQAAWCVINTMMREGATDDTIFDTILNAKLGDHYRDHPQGAEVSLRRHIREARNKSAKATAARKSEQEKLLDHLNGENAVIMDGGKTWVLRFVEVHHSAGGRRYTFLEPAYLRFQDLRNFYLNRRINIGDEEKPKWVDIGSWWLEHHDRRQYRGVTFQPSGKQVVDGYYNLWRGFGVEAKEGDWSKLKEHIKVVICADDEGFYEYTMKWLAWAVQHPDQRAEVALVFLGDRGTGKGTLGNALCAIFGQHQLHASTAEELTGRFNEHLRQCIFLFADEAYGPKDKAAEGELKRMVTEPTLRVEGKGRARITVPNNLHVVMASNNDWVIPAGAHERRFAVKKVANVHRQNRAWFEPLYKQLNEGGYEAMLYELLHIPLGSWHPRDDIPRTIELADQQEESLTPREEWWLELLQTGVLPGARRDDPSRPISNRYEETVTEAGNYGLSRKQTTRFEGLYDAARISTPRLKGTSDAALGRFLREHGCVPARPHRRRGWKFPSLDLCRQLWRQRFPATVWDDEQAAQWRHEGQ